MGLKWTKRTGLGKLEKELRTLAATCTDPAVWEQCAGIVVDRCKEALNRGGPASGKPWAPLVDGSGRQPLLARTGNGINSISVKASETGALIRAMRYMNYHQTGVWQGKDPLTGKLIGMGAVAKELAAVNATRDKAHQMSAIQRRAYMKIARGLETGRQEAKRQWLRIAKAEQIAIIQMIRDAIDWSWQAVYSGATEAIPSQYMKKNRRKYSSGTV